jgi:hypothetical protein
MRYRLLDTSGLSASGLALGTIAFGEARRPDAGDRGHSISPQPVDPAAAGDAVNREVLSWEGVTVHSHRFGGVEFRLGRRELGHIHTTIADLPFPRAVRDQLIAAGRAQPHHVLPDSGWVTVPVRTHADVSNVIALFRFNYERGRNPR